ncbi:MAG: glycosyltransferase family 4 protein [Gimesia sp.]
MIGTFHQPIEILRDSINKPDRLNRFSKIILMCDAQRQFFLDAGVAKDKIHVVYHGVDTEFFQPCPSPQPDKPFRVIFVGNYLRDFDCLVKVCHQLRNESDIEIHIVSNPHHREKFSSLNNVTYLSGLSFPELLDEYQNSACLLMTVQAATANNAIIEGLACGLPIVSQRIGGIPEYVNNDCAILCDPEDVDGLVNGILTLRDNPEKRKTMGLAARKQALSLDWKIIAKKTEAVYAQAADQKLK